MSNHKDGDVAPHGEPVYAQCHRWRTHLRTSTDAYRELEEERERGWKSPALDAWYNGHRTQTKPSDSAKGCVPSAAPPSTSAKRTEQSSTQSQQGGQQTSAPVPGARNGEAASFPAAGTTTTTSFVDANIAQLTQRYREHCQRILPSAAPHVFYPHAQKAEKLAPTFMDMGCAPGGVSKYLVEDLKWRGVGVTLPSTAGGIAVDAELLSRGDRFTLWEGDVTQSPSSWTMAAAASSTAGGNHKGAETVGTNWDATRRFTFVNGGAVQDHGQRLMQQAQLQQQPQEAVDTREASDVTTSGAILPWLTLFVPQLRTALAHVEEGGSIMLVYGAPQCASFMILLRALAPLLSPAGAAVLVHAGGASCDERPVKGGIAVCETMHIMKPPVYVLLTGVHTKGHEARIHRLLDALDPTSQVLSPLMPTDRIGDHAEAQPSEIDALRAADILRAKQLFWLGESDAGFAVAKEGLQAYGKAIDHVWIKATQCLVNRRLRAERAMERTEKPRNGIRSPFLKRPRAGDN